MAERPGGERPSQDRVFTTGNAVIVLDGASQPDASERDGGWIAEALGRELQAQLANAHSSPLADALGSSIAAVASRHGLKPRESPSTTVAIVRWNAAAVDVLVLGDSPVVAYGRDGLVHQVRDDRLALVTYARPGAPRPTGLATDRLDDWRAGDARQRELRNRPGGYWIAEASPEAAREAVCATWAAVDLAAVLVMTDGVSEGVDQYRTPADWLAALAIAVDDPARLIETVHQAEETDPDGVRWPRSKRHDDKAVALVRFEAI